MLITFGEVCGDLAALARGTIERIIAEKQDRETLYWILLYANAEGGQCIRSKFIICGEKPTVLLGTCCWEVDNVKGRCTMLWAQPLDIPLVDTGGIEYVGPNEAMAALTRPGAWATTGRIIKLQ